MNERTAHTEGTEILSFRDASVIAPPPYEYGLENVSLLLKAGELALVSVERGHGLSPLADAAQGLVEAAGGEILFLGENWLALRPRDAARARGKIGRVFMTGGWISNLNVDENITLPLRHHSGLSADEIAAAARKTGEFFGLKELPNIRPALLQKAILRRAEWTRAFLGEPALIILEEPLRDAYIDVLHYLIKGIAGALVRGAAVLWISGDFPDLSAVRLSPLKRYRLKGPRLEQS
ncbi:MAG: ATP-binding cassette domain-containing protein [PVC group bacterium]